MVVAIPLSIGWGERITISARLRAVAPDLVTLIGGVAIMLVWAGFIESFLSQYHQPVIPYWVKIAFGTDMGGIPWTEPIANEFGLMVKFGMSPMDAIKAATSTAANLLDMKGDIGVIAPGAFADVMAVQGDPLANVEALKIVKFVMKDGNVFKQ